MAIQQSPVAAASQAQATTGLAPITVQNPATGQIIGTVPRRTAEEVRAAVARARAAQPGWAALGFDGRGAVLRHAQRCAPSSEAR